MLANPSDASISMRTTAGSNINPFYDNSPKLGEQVTDENADSGQNIYEDIIDNAKLDTCENTKITSLEQLDKSPSRNINKKMITIQPITITNKCKPTSALLVVLVITIPVVSLIVWGIKSRDQENIKEEPVINLTSFTECWNKSMNYRKHCNNSLVTELTDIKENNITSENGTLRMWKKMTRTSQNHTSPVNKKTTGNISSLQSENLLLKQRVSDLHCLLKMDFSNCADLYQLGHHDDIVYSFDQCGKSYQLYCDMTQDGGGWTVIQRRFDGSVDFYRNWNTYNTGFGNLTAEFWLGNYIISLLTKHKKFDLHISLEDFEGDHRYAKYSDFQLGDEEKKYVLYIRNYSGDAGDALTYHKGMKFTTYDSDNDLAYYNCAYYHPGAFWFNRCHDANLNGRYSTTSRGAGSSKGLVWKQWKGFDYSLMKTTMKIRPIDF